MNILSIDERISRYSHSVKKAERLNTTGNRHYEEKKSVIYYLKLLMSYISPGGALAVANPAATDGSITINSATLTNECNRLLFDSINAALGIELMEWQKVYILTGRKARQGEATAIALRQLLNNTAQPIDLTDKAAGYYCAGTDEELDDYRNLIINMHDRLDNAGIPVRRILKDEQEFEEYLKPLKSIAIWFDMVAVHNGDYEREEYGDR
nr:MAG TPA: hypothetical protein [Caudoviricetes sp.]